MAEELPIGLATDCIRANSRPSPGQTGLLEAANRNTVLPRLAATGPVFRILAGGHCMQQCIDERLAQLSSNKGDPMDAQQRRALSSLVAAVVTTQTAAQPSVRPSHAVDTHGSSANSPGPCFGVDDNGLCA
jgi:hypothetical protein